MSIGHRIARNEMDLNDRDLSINTNKCGRHPVSISILLTILALSAMLSSVCLTRDLDAVPTRSDMTYVGYFDGEGPDDDIVLVGHRYYEVTYNFSGRSMDQLTYLNFSIIDLGGLETRQEILSYDVSSQVISVIDEGARMEVRSPSLNYLGGENFSLRYEVLFHMDWDRLLDFRLRPVLDYSSELVEPQPDRDLIMELEGELGDPILGSVTDEVGRTLENNVPVKSNSTIFFRNISFPYHSGEFSQLTPMSGELDPSLTVGDSNLNLTWEGSGYVGNITLPDKSSGNIEVGLNVPNIRDQFGLNMRSWEWLLKLDGIAPKFSLRSPTETSTQPSVEVNWTLVVTEQSNPSKLTMVDGGSIDYRIWREGENWTEWLSAEPVADGPSIIASGQAKCEIGINKSRLQFRASDLLGNTALSKEFSIHVNIPPVAEVPSSAENLTLFKNQTLILDGYEFATDEDNDKKDLTFKWKIDGKTVSSGRNLEWPLLGEITGNHTITLVVEDRFSSDSVDLQFHVEDAPSDEEEIDIWGYITSENFILIMTPIVFVVIVVALVVVILTIARSRAKKKEVDFVIDEEAFSDNSDTQDVVKKLQEMYTTEAEFTDEFGADAQMDTSADEFDFDYNLYDVLGLDQGASLQDIKRAYRKLAAYYHPDRVAMHQEVDQEEAAEEMLKINKAKEFLLNPERKMRYDDHLEDIEFSVDL